MNFLLQAGVLRPVQDPPAITASPPSAGAGITGTGKGALLTTAVTAMIRVDFVPLPPVRGSGPPLAAE